MLAAVIGGAGLGLYIAAFHLGVSLNIVPESLPAVWWRIPVLLLSAAHDGLLEEILVIGYLLRRLDQLGWTPWKAILAAAVLRGSYHLYQGFGAFLGNAVMGIIFGILYRRWGRVMPLIIAHTLIDAVTFVGYAALVAQGVLAAVTGAGATGRVRPGRASGRAGQRPSAASTTAPGRLASTAPGSVSLDRRTPLPMTTRPVAATAASTNTGQSRGQPDRRDPAVLHAGQLDRLVHRGERSLAYVQLALDQPVHVRAGGGEHHARRHPGLPVPAPGDDDAVGRLGRRDAVRARRRRQCRPAPDRSRRRRCRSTAILPSSAASAAATGAASRSGRSRAGTAGRLPMCIVTRPSLGR